MGQSPEAAAILAPRMQEEDWFGWWLGEGHADGSSPKTVEAPTEDLVHASADPLILGLPPMGFAESGSLPGVSGDRVPAILDTLVGDPSLPPPLCPKFSAGDCRSLGSWESPVSQGDASSDTGEPLTESTLLGFQ
uniref:Uncharacterized protein n=1 Tax=Sphaerodactylus townsendi TaxID=933632 RepID=A0ACB8GBF8_9SAUR